MPRKHDPTKARRHWVYDRAEVRKLFGVSESTVSNWTARGLRPVDDSKPQLFAGYELRRFLTSAA